jgi:hypothetical protein
MRPINDLHVVETEFVQRVCKPLQGLQLNEREADPGEEDVP